MHKNPRKYREKFAISSDFFEGYLKRVVFFEKNHLKTLSTSKKNLYICAQQKPP